MRKKRFSEEQIIQILKESDTGKTVEEISRRHGITKNTYYRWKKIYGGLDVSQARELRRLKEENQKLKKKLAELVMEVEDIRFLLTKKW